MNVWRLNIILESINKFPFLKNFNLKSQMVKNENYKRHRERKTKTHSIHFRI